MTAKNHHPTEHHKKHDREKSEVAEIVPSQEEIIPVTPLPETKDAPHIEIGTLNLFMGNAKPSEEGLEGGRLALPSASSREGLLLWRSLGLGLVLVLGIVGAILWWYGGIFSRQPLSLTIIFPKRVINEQPFDASLKVKNTSSSLLARANITPQLPETFKLISSTPLLTSAAWELPPLAPSEEYTISLRGILTSPYEEHHLFSFRPAFLTQEGMTSMAEIEKKIVSHASIISLESLINGQREFIANLGDPLRYTIRFANRSSSPLPLLRFEIDLGSPLFDLQAIKLKSGRLVGRKIIIDNASSPLLRALAPEGGGIFEVNLGVLPYVPDTLKVSGDPPLLTIGLQALLTKNDGLEEMFAQETHLKINSDLGLLTQVRYFSPDGEQVGRGPLPPERGSKTTYWIYFRLGNILNTLHNSVLTLTFAKGDVGWTSRGATSQGSDFLFDPFLREARWVIGEIPANRSFSLLPPSASLEVFAVPSATDRSKIPLLLQEITLSGQDSFTGNLIEKKFPPLDADLRFDERGKALGYKVK